MAEEKEDLDFLKSFTVFEDLSREQLTQVTGELIRKKYQSGQTIFFEEEEGSQMYFVRSGRIKILRTSSEGREQIIKFLGEGEVFGEVVLFGIERYPVSAICLEDCELDVLTRQSFQDFFLKHPEIGLGMLETMAQKLYYSQSRIKSLSLQDSRSKIIQALLQLSGEDKTVRIQDLNQQQLANFLGMTRETVSRNLSQLKKDNYIKMEGREIIILNREELGKLIE